MIKGKFAATIEIDIAVDENTPNLLPFEKLKGVVQNDMETAVKDLLCDEFGDIATVKVTKTFADLYRTVATINESCNYGAKMDLPDECEQDGER